MCYISARLECSFFLWLSYLAWARRRASRADSISTRRISSAAGVLVRKFVR